MCDEKDLNLHGIKLAIGGNKNDYVTIQEKDLIKYDVKPTLTGLMDFIKENYESILGFLDREYISEEGNVIYLNCAKKSVTDNIFSIKVQILASMQQRGLFLQQEHKYYGIQLYVIIELKTFDDDKFLELLKELEIDWELIYFRRRLAIHDWTEIECEKNSENLKNFLRAKYETLNYFDVNNIARLVIKNQLSFKHSSRNVPLKLSIKQLSVGLPGLIKCSFTPRLYAHASKARLMNSGPLSTTMLSGSPRLRATRSRTVVRTVTSP